MKQVYGLARFAHHALCNGPSSSGYDVINPRRTWFAHECSTTCTIPCLNEFRDCQDVLATCEMVEKDITVEKFVKPAGHGR
jgi:hypothetical protein